MPSTTTARILGGLLVVTSLAVTGCTSSTKGTGVTAPPVTSQPAVSSPPPSASPSTPSGSETITRAEASAALLTPEDIGPGFQTAQFRTSDDPSPCTPNEPPIEQQIPATLEVGSAITSTRFAAAIGEDLRFYPDDATAHDVIQLAAVGLDCPQGKLAITGAPEPVTFGGEQDVSAAVGADEAVAVPASTARFSIVLIGCRVGRLVVLFDFLRTKATPTSSLPNPISVVAKALQKIKNS